MKTEELDLMIQSYEKEYERLLANVEAVKLVINLLKSHGYEAIKQSTEN